MFKNIKTSLVNVKNIKPRMLSLAKVRMLEYSWYMLEC